MRAEFDDWKVVALSVASGSRPFAQLAGLEGGEGIVYRAGIAYAVRDDGAEAIVAPRYVVHYASRRTLPSGEVTVSRQKCIAYSPTDPMAAPEDLSPRPNPGSQGDERNP